MIDIPFEQAAEELSRATPDISRLRSLLPQISPTSLDLSSRGSLLHIAAKYDTLHCRKAGGVRLLVEDYGFDPNFQNQEGSIAVLWAVAAYVHSQSKDLEAVKFLMLHPVFDVNQRLTIRGGFCQFVSEHYGMMSKTKVILRLIAYRRARNLCPVLLARMRLRKFCFTH